MGGGGGGGTTNNLDLIIPNIAKGSMTEYKTFHILFFFSLFTQTILTSWLSSVVALDLGALRWSIIKLL